MAIKINGQDLLKRFINGQEIVRVYKNGGQIRPETVPPVGAGIYHNATLGLISLSSDGENWITIADKNLGATQVYNDGDTLSQANVGFVYQRGNNYGFPYKGNVTTSSSQVDASTYGPTNPYYDSTWRNYNGNWDSSNNKNLWGDVTNTLEARQGPCANGFHIPTNNEITSLTGVFRNLEASPIIAKLAPGGRYNSNYSLSDSGTAIYLWVSDGTVPSDNPSNRGYRYHFISRTSYGFTLGISPTTRGATIRPFKNTYVVPDSTRTVLYQPS